MEEYTPDMDFSLEAHFTGNHFLRTPAGSYGRVYFIQPRTTTLAELYKSLAKKVKPYMSAEDVFLLKGLVFPYAENLSRLVKHLEVLAKITLPCTSETVYEFVLGVTGFADWDRRLPMIQYMRTNAIVTQPANLTTIMDFIKTIPGTHLAIRVNTPEGVYYVAPRGDTLTVMLPDQDYPRKDARFPDVKHFSTLNTEDKVELLRHIVEILAVPDYSVNLECAGARMSDKYFLYTGSGFEPDKVRMGLLGAVWRGREPPAPPEDDAAALLLDGRLTKRSSKRSARLQSFIAGSAALFVGASSTPIIDTLQKVMRDA
jgi:hypothetical protein